LDLVPYKQFREDLSAWLDPMIPSVGAISNKSYLRGIPEDFTDLFLRFWEMLRNARPSRLRFRTELAYLRSMNQLAAILSLVDGPHGLSTRDTVLPNENGNATSQSSPEARQ
jgi:hypothetical protein